MAARGTSRATRRRESGVRRDLAPRPDRPHIRRRSTKTHPRRRSRERAHASGPARARPGGHAVLLGPDVPSPGAPAQAGATVQGQGDRVGPGTARRHRRRAAGAARLQVRHRPRHRPGRPPSARVLDARVRGSGTGRLGRVGGADLALGLGRAARARRLAARPLRAHPVARARLLRAKPRRLADLAPDQRRGRARGARDGRAHFQRSEHAAAVRHRRHAALPRLAPGAGDAVAVPADGGGDRALPHLLGARLPSHARAPRRRHGDPRRRISRARASSRRSGARSSNAESFAVVSNSYRERQPAHRSAERLVLPVRRLARLGLDRDRARLRRRPLLRRSDHARDAVRVHALPLEFLRPDPGALAALQHVPGRQRGARQDLRRHGHGARAPGRGGRPRAAADRGRGRTARRALPIRPGRRGAARHRPRRRAPARPSRWSATLAQASRRW